MAKLTTKDKKSRESGANSSYSKNHLQPNERNNDDSSVSSSSVVSSFADETSVGIGGGDGDNDDNDDNAPATLTSPTSEDEVEKTMITKNKISNTGRWKLFVVALMFVNTSVVIAATSLFLNNEADKEFERTVRV